MAGARRDLGHHETPSAPFPPHATLLSGLSVEKHGQVDAIWAKAQAMLAAWRKGRAESVDATTLDVPFDSLKSNGTYFQVGSESDAVLKTQRTREQRSNFKK